MPKNNKAKEKPSQKFLATEWARMKGKREANYVWFNTNLGLINEKEFNEIKL